MTPGGAMLDSPGSAQPAPGRPGRFGLVWEWAATIDHKKIGILYLLTAGFFLLVGGAEALTIRWQLLRPHQDLLDPDTYNQLFTMHGTTMIFLVVVPTLLGLGNYLVPLMIGARDMAFPRLNAFSYWLVPLGGLLLHYSVLAGGAPSAGWFSYAPLSETPFSSTSGVDYWVLALLIIGTGSIATSINLIVTVVTLRAPGMSLARLPLFVWMTFVNSFLVILAIPALNAAIIMLLFDRQLNAHFFLPAHQGSALLWQHFFWTFGHPEVYIMVLPAFGIISEVLPVFSRRPIFGYEFIAASTVAIALLSFGVWAHHMFAVGLSHPVDLFFAASSMLIAVPTGVKIFNWSATLWGGAIRLTTALEFAAAFLIQFTIGGLSGVAFAVVPIDWQLTDTYFLVAHMHYVLFGGTLFAVFAGIYYWFPKMTGRLLSERLGSWHFWLTLIGFNMAFFVQHFLGLMGMPRRVYTYPDLPYWGLMNAVSTVGAFLLGAATVILLINVVRSRRLGREAGDNPWQAWTLEWATSSPPPPENFQQLPPVRSRRPLWDLVNPERRDEPLAPLHLPPEKIPEKARLAMLLFIASEGVFFVMLIAAYLFFNQSLHLNQWSGQHLHPLKTGLFTLCLLLSSWTFHRAEQTRRAGTGHFVGWIALTMVLGFIFLGGQGWEYFQLFREGLALNTGLFSSTFYLLTGFHGLHVLIGLILLSIVLVSAWSRPTRVANSLVQSVGIYWHFVDAVWIVVFLTVYLIGTHV